MRLEHTKTMKNYFLIAATLFAGLFNASAHLSVGGDRTLGTIDNTTVTNNARTVSSSFGWADATDDNFGDSHRLTAFKFTLGSTQNVTITVSRRNATGQTGANDTLLPAFSLYTLNGTFVSSTHDTSAGSTSYLTGLYGTGATAETFIDSNSNTFWDTGESFTDANGNGVWDGAGAGGSGKEGAFRALNNWRIYQDNGDPNTTLFNDFTYVANAADGNATNYGSASGINGDGIADGSVTATFNNLTAGDYYFLAGGADYLSQNTDQLTSGPSATFKSYGIGVTVGAVPEPSTYVLFAVGAIGIGIIRRLQTRKV